MEYKFMFFFFLLTNANVLEIINGCVGLCYIKLMSEHPEIDILMEMFNYYNTEERS